MTKKEIRAVIDEFPWPSSPFKIKGEYVCLEVQYERIGATTRGRKMWIVKYGQDSISAFYSKSDLINYLYERVNK